MNFRITFKKNYACQCLQYKKLHLYVEIFSIDLISCEFISKCQGTRMLSAWDNFSHKPLGQSKLQFKWYTVYFKNLLRFILSTHWYATPAIGFLLNDSYLEDSPGSFLSDYLQTNWSCTYRHISAFSILVQTTRPAPTTPRASQWCWSRHWELEKCYQENAAKISVARVRSSPEYLYISQQWVQLWYDDLLNMFYLLGAYKCELHDSTYDIWALHWLDHIINSLHYGYVSVFLFIRQITLIISYP